MRARILFLVPLLLLNAFAKEPAAPNIIVIMVDDMGFSDLGCYGSEIKTPHLDSLAAGGLRFTHFYNAGRCCPTRASLLTGLYQHQAGVGMMTTDEGIPGYRGFLNNKCVTLAEALSPAGYFTAISGKWHVGSKPSQWPCERGFDRFYGTPQGGGHHYRNLPGRDLVLNSTIIPLPDSWYSTTAFTDHAIKFLEEGFAAKKPVLLYLAYTAPHWALHAPDEAIATYRGKYAKGWQPMREARFARQMKMGLFPPGTKLSPQDPKVPSWDKVKDKEEMDLRMATHAAMVDLVDQGVGRLVANLKKHDQLDNTLILFFSDNGASSESGPTGFTGARGGDPKARTGTPNSYNSFGIAGANLCDTPFRRYKRETHEGGIATPLIAHWPAGIAKEKKGSLVTTPAHIIDLMPTFLDLSGGSYPAKHREQTPTPLEGTSLKPLFKGHDLPERALFFEHMGNAAVRIGPWKLVRPKGKAWELYHLGKDRTELNNLAQSNPERVKSMAAKWTEWAKRVNAKLRKKKKK